MRFGSVCSGIEAASVAWHPLGWQAAWLAEIEAFPSAALAHHYPDTPNLGDMTTIARRVLTGEVEAPDVLTGGTPCQAFSVAGLRESLADERGNLTLKFVELADAIDHVRDRRGEPGCVIVWENVPGVLSTKDNAFGCFLAGLAGEDDPLVPPGDRWADSGCVYGPARAIAWRTLDAQYLGLAQRRRRVFVVASARDGFDPAQVLFEWQGVRRDSAPSRQAGEGTAAATAPSLTASGRGVERSGESRGQDPVVAVAGTLQANGKAAGSATQQDAEAGLLVPSLFSIMPMNSGKDYKAREVDVAQPLMAGGPVNGNQGGDVIVQPIPILDGAKGRTDKRGSRDGSAMGNPGDPMFTLRAGASHALAQPVAFQTRGSNVDVGPISGTMGQNAGSASGCAPMVALAFDCKASGQNGFGVGEVASTMRAMGHAGSHQNGGGHQAVAIALRGREGGATAELGGEVGNALRASGGGGDKGHVLAAMQVRRLTPVECARLQGFPDDYLDITYRGKPAADGPKYKALGNSWAVPVARWVGRRVQQHLEATA